MSDNQEVVTATTENAGEVVDTEVKEPKATSDEPKQKMFTQEEVDKIVADRLARAKKQPIKVNDGLQKQVASLQNQIAQYEIALAKSKYKIVPDYEGYVDYIVTHKTSKDVSYEQALKEYLEGDGKKFLQAEEEPKVAKQQPRPKNSNTMESATPTSDLRKMFGLK